MKRYYLISLILHCLLLIATIKATPPKKSGSGQGNSIEVSTESGEGSNGDGGDSDNKKIITKGEDGEGEPCDDWYGGIGIIQDFENEITYVAPGYPADNAGIRLGDVIVSQGEIRGEPGTILELTIFRKKIKLTFKLIREKICTYKEDY